MNRKQISDALDGISMDYLAECEAYRPSEQETPMKHKRRKLTTLLLAACLILGLGITAYSADALHSLYGRWLNQTNTLQMVTPELAESQPDYAQWLESQWETQADLVALSEKMRPANETRVPEGRDDCSITLLEYCYDGKEVAMACRLEVPELPTLFDFDETHPKFADLGPMNWEPEDWTQVIPPDVLPEVKHRLETSDGVGFTTYALYLPDHFHSNGEYLGCWHTDPDENGLFFVEPFYPGLDDECLPESCIDQPTVDITMPIRWYATHYWVHSGTVQTTYDLEDYPVTFTLENCG